MTELRRDTWTMPGGRLGPEDPLPRLTGIRGPHGRFKDVDEKLLRMFQYGQVPGCLPYRLQSNYDRDLTPQTFRTAVLENEELRAVFLLELGGRLWSLVHKPSGRELLYVNPVFQAANLAIRGAWFSGGIEWNIGIRGHSVFTCAPMFAARVAADDGSPVLRLYEWERIRQTPFQIDFSLPEGSAFLFVRTRVINPLDHEVPMYWWSNVGVPEEDGARVVVPAVSASKFTYDGRVRETSIPIHEGVDRTYAAGSPNSADDFYRLLDGHPPWIAALDRDGRGLVEMSSPRLLGRKMFRWGMGPGGRRWHRFLSPPDGIPYVEIQAGLTQTQAECLPMPAHDQWEWIEAYGLLEADPRVVHGDDWPAAIETVETALVAALPPDRLAARFAATRADADRAPDEVLHRASGWGALERRRRRRSGDPAFCSEALVFDDESLGPEQAPWLALLEDGVLPDGDPVEAPASWMVQAEWRRLLEEAVSAGRGDHWLSWLHLGVMAYYAGEAERAIAAHEKSLALAPSAWAYRNLALIAMQQERFADGADQYLAAREMQPDLASLALECCRAQMRAGRSREMLELSPKLPAPIRQLPRVRLFEARAALDLDDLDTVQAILESRFTLSDLREGEISLTDLWFGMHEKRIARDEGIPIDDALRERVQRECPPPPHLDFRMFAKRRRRRRAAAGSE